MIFQALNVHESASLFNLKEEKKLAKTDMKSGRIWTHHLENLMHHANH